MPSKQEFLCVFCIKHCCWIFFYCKLTPPPTPPAPLLSASPSHICYYATVLPCMSLQDVVVDCVIFQSETGYKALHSLPENARCVFLHPDSFNRSVALKMNVHPPAICALVGDFCSCFGSTASIQELIGLSPYSSSASRHGRPCLIPLFVSIISQNVVNICSLMKMQIKNLAF